MDSLLDLSVRGVSARRGSPDVYRRGPTIADQRRFAEVASDLARSPVFMSVLLESGRLTSFLREAVGVFTRAAAGVSVHVLEGNPAAGGFYRARWRGNGERVDDRGDKGGGGRVRVSGGWDSSTQYRDVVPPEPLLCALSCFCLEHSPARSAFVQVLLGLGDCYRQPSAAVAATPKDCDGARSGRSNGENNNSKGGGDQHSSCHVMDTMDPCTALFMLCLHPHAPTAAAASALLQCLLVGGGALGAVSGPSAGAAAGIGVIPAAYPVGALGGLAAETAGGGIGRGDPLQAKLLKTVGAVAFGGGQFTPGSDNNDFGVGFGSRSGPGSGNRRKGSGESKAGIGKTTGGEHKACLTAAAQKSLADGEDGNTTVTNDSSDSDEDAEGREASWGYATDTHPFEDLPAGEKGGTLASPPGPLIRLLLGRLQTIGTDLAAAQAKEQLELGGTRGQGATSRKRVAFVGGCGGSSSGVIRESNRGMSLRGRAVEAEQEVTSLLCLMSALVSDVSWILTAMTGGRRMPSGGSFRGDECFDIALYQRVGGNKGCVNVASLLRCRTSSIFKSWQEGNHEISRVCCGAAVPMFERRTRPTDLRASELRRSSRAYSAMGLRVEVPKRYHHDHLYYHHSCIKE